MMRNRSQHFRRSLAAIAWITMLSLRPNIQHNCVDSLNSPYSNSVAGHTGRLTPPTTLRPTPTLGTTLPKSDSKRIALCLGSVQCRLI